MSGPARTGLRPLVLVLADGLRDDTARQAMGYLGALHEAGRARWATLSCELPSLSRPLYATVISGQRPLDHGVISNEQPGLRLGDNLFDTLHAAGATSAVAAYHWFRELLSGEVFQPVAHRESTVAARGVVAARWYWEDDYPDSHLLVDAETLRRQHQPDLLFIHPMGPDHAGHQHGGDSDRYRLRARVLDMQLAHLIPRWLAAGFEVVLTSDHGMAADHMHGGTAREEREVPFVWIPAAAREAELHARPLSDPPPAWPGNQLGVRAFVESRLGLGLGTAAAGRAD